MGNVSGNAYALTVLIPIKNDNLGEVAFADIVRSRLENWNMLPNSPMARVPETYLCRFYLIDDVYIESQPSGSAPDTWADYLPITPGGLRRAVMPKHDHLQSKYLVFSAELHGDRDTYLRGMWTAISEEIKDVFGFCYGFDAVNSADAFVAYMKKCQRNVALFFNGSNDDALEEQLKALYVKQEFTRFALENQGLPTAELRKNFQAFIGRVAPTHIPFPSWTAGQYSLPKVQDKQQEAAL
jgi:hypothetical protein